MCCNLVWCEKTAEASESPRHRGSPSAPTCPLVPSHLGRPDADPRRPHEAAVRRHATLPQAWIQPEHWEFETHTVKRILHDHGIVPAPERNQRTPWKTFLQTHWEGLAAADLFTVEVLTLAGLRRYFVFFVIELKTRRGHIAGIHPQPDGQWMEQMARNLTDPVDGFLRTARQLIHDRDPLLHAGLWRDPGEWRC